MKANPLIAVVDDDVSLRQALGSLFKSLDIDCERFGGAGELLASPPLSRFSCFLTDVVMPGLSGFELVEELRARGHSQPAIFMTAHKKDGYSDRALALGATCLISKPFTTDEMMACVEEALSPQDAGGPSSIRSRPVQ